jgi:anthranilate synthase component 1
MGRFPAYNLDAAALEAASRRGGVVPLVREVPADLVTPVGAYLALAAAAPRAFLLESAESGVTTGRWSFLGWEPTASISLGAEERDPLGTLRRMLHRYRPADVPGVPPFAGGLVGRFDYDAVRWFEPIGTTRGSAPWAHFDLYETVVALDHLRRRALVVVNVDPSRSTLEREAREARERAETIAAALLAPRIPPEPRATAAHDSDIRSGTRREDFLAGVERLKEHIRAGDIFQAVLSQRFSRPMTASPFAVYRALRRINPSPYLFFLKEGERALAGSSPEMLVRCTGDRVETHPIAGTRARDDDPVRDAALEAELRADPKENAEHLMLVDLGRNDLGRVAVPGSVRVERYAAVERYSHVMHLVSRVEARLAPGRDALDALAAAFPAGTVSGAPKVRAMQLLDELEPAPRGPYAGAVGYLDFHGNLDSCIAIRTLVAEHGSAFVQAGAGIVADSVPDREYEETVSKARALFHAVELAEEGAA